MSDSITVGPLQRSEESAWDRYVAGHPEGFAYHTLAWRNVTRDGLRHEPVYLRAVTESGQFLGVLPLFYVSTLLGRRLVSLPMRDRGSLLADNDQVAAQLIEAAVAWASDVKCRWLDLRSTTPLPDLVAERCRLTLRRHWVNSTIDLTPGSEMLWRAMPRTGARRAVSRARKRGLTVEIDDSRAGIVAFHRLFVRTRTHMGIPPYGQSFFLALHKYMISPGYGHLFSVVKDGHAIGGAIRLVSKGRMFAAYAAPQNEYRGDNPTELFFWEMIDWGCRNGCTVLELGADSPHQEGLIRFKQKFRAVQDQTYNYLHLQPGQKEPEMDSSATSFSLARNVWSRLPLPLSRVLGSWVARQLD